MAYIIQRKDRFYVVSYDDTDPSTGRERRRWHPAGHSRADAEAIRARLEASSSAEGAVVPDQLTLGRYLTERWMPRRRQRLQLTTAYRYQLMIDKYIQPTLGSMPLRSLQAEHLYRLYADLLATGGARGIGLAPKTVYDVHVIIRAALNKAVCQHLVATNVAHAAQAPRPRARERSGPECWNADQLTEFLAATQHLRLYPALHLSATTGMRRGEIAGLRWGDWHRSTHRLSIARSRQVVGGRSTEVPVKTRSSRRCIDLAADTEKVLERWQRRQRRDGHGVDLADPMFTNAAGKPVHAESLYQLFERQIGKLGLPRIRLHDIRHTHASLLLAAGVPIKVVSERLGHANPGFTMATYQHVLPGMGAAAAAQFAQLITRPPHDAHR